jgi:hypothetical protein
MRYFLVFKNISNRLWSIFFSITIALLLVFSTLLLIWTDTYSILHPKNIYFFDEPNRNFLKVEYILAHPDRYDSFIFGSSRVGAILTYNLKDGHYYNMTHSEGIPHEHLLNLRLFLNHGVKIKKVLLGLDEFSYQVSFTQHQQRWLTRAHPLATNSSWLEFYTFYFFRLPTKHDRSQFFKKLQKSNQVLKMDIDDQDYFYRTYLALLPNVKADDPKYLIPTHYSGNVLKETLQDIRDIVTLCKKNNIELTVFMNPIHHTTYADTNKVLLQEFKYSLKSITPYYDFSGPSTITTNNLNFLDTSHYTTDIGNYMIETMFDNKKSHQTLK